MQAAASASTAPTPAPSGVVSHNFQKRVSEAQSYYARLQPLVTHGLANEKLAEAVLLTFQGVGKNKIFLIKSYAPKIPYQVKAILDDLKMELPDIMSNLFKRATFVSILFQNTFKFYLRQRIIGQRHVDIFEVHQNALTKVPSETFKEIPKEGYILFMSHNDTLRCEKLPQEKCYIYRPLLKASMDMKIAPFHHEIQRLNLCGMHAINSFVGCSYFQEDQFRKYLEVWSSFSGVPPSTEKNDGVDPTFITFVLNIIVSSSTKYEIRYIEASSDPTVLITELQTIDRFILCATGGCGHCLAYRKDTKNALWSVDSQWSDQESFEHESEVVAEIFDDLAKNQISLILPLGEKVVSFKDHPPPIS